MVQNEYDLHESAATWDALVKVYAQMPVNGGILRTSESILTLEGLPNIASMALQGILSPQDVLKLRNAPATREFREWLWSQPDPSDSAAVGKEYARAIAPEGRVDKAWFKVGRILAINAATAAGGAAIGGSLAGVPGAIVGGVVGAVGSVADTFGVEKLLRGVNPRRFAEKELRPRVAAAAVGQSGLAPNRKERRAAQARDRAKK